MDLLKLIDLQDLDMSSDRLKRNRENLPELEKYRQANGERQQADTNQTDLTEQLRSLELEVDKQQGELEIIETELKEMETRLFSGGMSGRETENMRMGVEERRDRVGQMEEGVLDLLEQRDRLRDELAEATKIAEQAQAVESDLNRTITQSWEQIDQQLAQLSKQADQMSAGIEAELLELYQELRQTKSGIAIAKLEEEVCGGCNLSLSPPEVVESSDYDPPRCVHCLRILVIS